MSTSLRTPSPSQSVALSDVEVGSLGSVPQANSSSLFAPSPSQSASKVLTSQEGEAPPPPLEHIVRDRLKNMRIKGLKKSLVR